MVGVNVADNSLVGIGVTTHSETPGVGSRAQTDEAFVAQFRGLPFEGEFKVKPDGGQVDALSGATITSRAVASAVTDAAGIYDRLKSQLAEQLKSFPK